MEPIVFDRGVFTLSLDLELIWGTLDLFGPNGFRRACEHERDEVIDRLLDLFVEHEISATWGVVGHLFLDRCEERNGVKHPEIHPPASANGHGRSRWFEHDPCSDEASAPTFYGKSLVEKIRACVVPQEIGCHSFSHVIFDDPGCSRETAESEIAECVRLARETGLELRSFVFPRNRAAHLDVLREHGFRCFRGADPYWYEQGRWPTVVKRLGHVWDVMRAATPPVARPRQTEDGLWNVPGSMIYFPMNGLRRFIPVERRVLRAVKGLEAACEERAVFHLWSHPTNLAEPLEPMLGGLRRILEHARKLRDRGRLRVLPMGRLVDEELALES